MPGSSDRPRIKHIPVYTKTAGRQVLKSSIGKGIVRSGGRATARVGARSARVLANVLRSGSRMYSVTILRSLMRALMANVITAVITLALFTLYDVIIWLRKERTGRQLLVNLISNIWVITWGTIAFFLWEIFEKCLVRPNRPRWTKVTGRDIAEMIAWSLRTAEVTRPGPGWKYLRRPRAG